MNKMLSCNLRSNLRLFLPLQILDMPVRLSPRYAHAEHNKFICEHVNYHIYILESIMSKLHESLLIVNNHYDVRVLTLSVHPSKVSEVCTEGRVH